MQQLIHHTECMGPALAGDALGLSAVFREALQRAEEASAMLTAAEQRPYGRLISADSTAGSGAGGAGGAGGSTTSSLLMVKQETTSGIFGDTSVLTFYTALMRLLACCATRPADMCSAGKLPAAAGANSTGSGEGEGTSSSATRHKQSAIYRTRSILQNLIKVEEIVAILSLRSSGGGGGGEGGGGTKEQGLSAFHKEAALLFFDRVYGVTGPELLLQLLNGAFIPDVKLALQLAQKVRRG